MLKYQISILMVFRVFFSILYRYLLILIQYWEKTLNTIKVLIWYFSISNNIFFFILTSYLGNGILGNVYVPSKYSQHNFTPVCCHVCSVDKYYKILPLYPLIYLLTKCLLMTFIFVFTEEFQLLYIHRSRNIYLPPILRLPHLLWLWPSSAC